MFENRDEYIGEFRKINSKMLGVSKFNRGLEVDFSPRFMDKVGDFVNRTEWDILLCSVHEFGDGHNVETKPRNLNQNDEENRWQTYVQLQMIAPESSFVPFSILAHPVRISKGTSWVPDDIDEMLSGLAETARRNNRALELNGNDIDYNVQMVRRLASACSKAHCPVSLGSDAHRPKDVFRNVDIAIHLVDEFKLELAKW